MKERKKEEWFAQPSALAKHQRKSICRRVPSREKEDDEDVELSVALCENNWFC
jgi:hypothetical protein